MIVETRYRDIPWDEVKKCQPTDWLHADAPQLWEQWRGKLIRIDTPASGIPARSITCSGPFFIVEGKPTIVCPHIAEIGD